MAMPSEDAVAVHVCWQPCTTALMAKGLVAWAFVGHWVIVSRHSPYVWLCPPMLLALKVPSHSYVCSLKPIIYGSIKMTSINQCKYFFPVYHLNHRGTKVTLYTDVIESFTKTASDELRCFNQSFLLINNVATIFYRDYSLVYIIILKPFFQWQNKVFK